MAVVPAAGNHINGQGMKTGIKTQVSLKDIARKTGLSTPTISQILNGKTTNFSSDATKARVFEAARELGYRPNFGYKVMRGQATKTVSLVVSLQRVLEENYIQELILRLMAELDRRGYGTYISTFALSPEENIDKVKVLMSRGAESFVFLGTPVGHLGIRELLRSHGKAYIGYGSDFERDVTPDTTYGFEAILRHFLGRGRKNIKLIMTDEPKRFQGLRNVFPGVSDDELKARHLVEFALPQYSAWTHMETCFNIGHEMTRQALAMGKDVDALIYLSDIFAVGGVKFLLDNNYRVGSDIAVAGHNYTDMVKYSPYPISSVEHDAAATTAALMENFAGVEPMVTLVKPIVHIR